MDKIKEIEGKIKQHEWVLGSLADTYFEYPEPRSICIQALRQVIHGLKEELKIYTTNTKD
jgi:hypothetical protein